MKHLDRVTQRILAISLSAMGLILCLTLFFATVNPASASNTNNLDLSSINGSSASSGGVIMMDYTSVHVPSQDKTYYEILVWNSETGQSKLYFYDYSAEGFEPYQDNVQLPAHPLD